MDELRIVAAVRYGRLLLHQEVSGVDLCARCAEFSIEKHERVSH
jgi:hypothetical protein